MMIKRLFLLFSIIVFSSARFFAYDGVMAGERDLKIIKTEHFDIIYPERGKDCAAIIAANCESLYTELSELYGLDYDFRLPVTISTTYQGMNAYFSPAPFNHIVFFANQPKLSMDIYTNESLSIFKHELTHAINYNLKNKFWHNLSSTLGDSYTGGLLGNTPFIYEGLAVKTESLEGEGRVNDEETLHLIRQAKIENVFPNFAQIQGAMDIAPSLTGSYVFGGYFWQWLTDKYGNEKFTEYIKGCNNLKSLFYARFFKKVYGISFEEVWNLFYDEITVPQVTANPADNDFCEYLLDKHNISNYSALCSCSNGFYYYDSNKSGVFSLEQQVKVIADDNIFNLNVSSDGRYLVTEGYDYSSRVYRTIIKVYDLQNKSKIIYKDYGVSEGTVVKTEYGYFIVYFKYDGKNGPHNGSIMIKPLQEDGHLVQLPLGFGNTVFSICDGGDGRAYFLYKNGLKDYICSLSMKPVEEELNVDLCVEIDYNEQSKIKRRIKGISASNGKILFSYIDKDTLLRFGIAERESSFDSDDEIELYKIKLMTHDLSGGVYYPALSADGNELAYIGKFYRGNQMFKLDLNQMEFENTTVKASVARFSCIQYSGEPEENVRYEIENPAKINPDLTALEGSREITVADFFRKGTFVPVGLVSGKTPDERNNSLLSSAMLCGASYISASPWTYPLYMISGGYSLLNKNYGIKGKVYGSTDTKTFDYSIEAQAEGDYEGFKNVFSQLECSSSLPISSLCNFTMSGNLSIYYGRLNLIPVEGTLLEGGGFGFLPTIFASAGFSNLHSCNSGSYENTGFKLLLQYISEPKFENIGLYGSVTIPRLLPVRDDTNWMTYNLPLTLECALFTNENYFLQAGASLVLFSTNIQYAAIKFPYLYFKRFSVSASYVAKFGVEDLKTKSWAVLHANDYLVSLNKHKCIYNDEISLNLSLKLTPNIGGSANSSIAVTVVSSFMYRPNPAKDQKRFDFNVGSNLAF